MKKEYSGKWVLAVILLGSAAMGAALYPYMKRSTEIHAQITSQMYSDIKVLLDDKFSLNVPNQPLLRWGDLNPEIPVIDGKKISFRVYVSPNGIENAQIASQIKSQVFDIIKEKFNDVKASEITIEVLAPKS